MFDIQVIKLASNTKNYGLTKTRTHTASFKNKLCGDKITIELNADKIKIKSMRYETESCIYCQASASILSYAISSMKINKLKRDFIQIENFFLTKENKLPKKYKVFKILMKKKNKDRYKCIMLPFYAVRKALNI
jgi:nitrogen fixation NifU-like protein|tara:strand:- start:701 stop:1102 length:402 start_codon:yes stop_codon:yes gene_type:complete